MVRVLVSFAALLLLASCSSTPKANEMSLLRPRVHAVLDSHMDDFNGCYKRSLKANPKLSGTMTMDFEVGDSGKIVRLNTNTSSTSLRDKNVQNCVAKVMKGLSFPSAPSGAVLVTSYPFLFVPPQ
jgi:hypothetical protein